MTRPSRDLAPALSAFYARRFPHRPPRQTEFDDDLLVLADFLWAQIDPDGNRPLVYPPMAADGYQPQPSVKPSGKRPGRPE